MAFDLQSLLAALGMGGAGGPITGTQYGGQMGAPMQPQPQLAPNSTTPPGLTGLFGGGGQGIGPMGLLGAGASMLNASGPGNAGLGSIFGSGIGGLLQGSQLDRTDALQQQQQAALQRIAQQLMQKPAGAQPAAASMPGGGPQGVPQPPVMLGSGPPPAIPGAPPVPAPAPQTMSGGMPLGGPPQSTTNPFIAMMLQRRMGRMA